MRKFSLQIVCQNPSPFNILLPGVDHLDPEHYQSVVFAFEDAAGAGSAVEFVEPTQIFVLVKCSILKKGRGGKSRTRN